MTYWDQHLVATYPKDWWQALKKRFLPAWVLKKYPVKNEEVNIQVWVIYPELLREILPEQVREMWIDAVIYNSEDD